MRNFAGFLESENRHLPDLPVQIYILYIHSFKEHRRLASYSATACKCVTQQIEDLNGNHGVAIYKYDY